MKRYPNTSTPGEQNLKAVALAYLYSLCTRLCGWMSTKVEAVSRQTIGDGFHIAMVYHQLERMIQLVTRLENSLLACQDKDAKL